MGDKDGHWVALARQGDQQAFRHLLNLHARSLFRLCARITRDPALAEDAVQEAFYKAWRGLSEFEDRSTFASWLHRIAVNAALQELRRNARHRRELTAPVPNDDAEPDLLAHIEDERPGPDLQVTGAQISAHIGETLDRLSGVERAAFVMRHCEGESLETIGATLALNIGQCKQAIFRAVGKLRAALEMWR
jgi:RNA polymerase sigma-70 factor (ECF subfamily)